MLHWLPFQCLIAVPTAQTSMEETMATPCRKPLLGLLTWVQEEQALAGTVCAGAAGPCAPETGGAPGAPSAPCRPGVSRPTGLMGLAPAGMVPVSRTSSARTKAAGRWERV